MAVQDVVDSAISCGAGLYEQNAIRDTHRAVNIAKQILLDNRVKEFTAADVVALANLITAQAERSK